MVHFPTEGKKGYTVEENVRGNDALWKPHHRGNRDWQGGECTIELGIRPGRWRRERLASNSSLASQQQQLVSETPEERAAHLEQLILNQQQRLVSETPGERAACLEQLTLNHQQRLGYETPGERAACLEQLSLNHQQRLGYEIGV